MVNIFDNLQTFLQLVVELVCNILHGFRMLPQLIIDSGAQLLRYRDCFPPFIGFVFTFLFGAGILKKLSKWGN